MKFSVILVELSLNLNDNHYHLKDYIGTFFIIYSNKYLANVELGIKVLFRISLMLGFTVLYIYSWLVLYQ